MVNFQRLRFPVGGISKRLAYSYSEPYTTPSASNVRGDDSTGRERGGSRPGIGKAYSQLLGSGNKVRLLSDVQWVNSGTRASLLLASANGILYRDVAGTLTAVSSAITLASDVQLQAAELLQKLYIAGNNTATRDLTVYDPAANTLANVVATAGTIPTKCQLVCVWNGRLVLAGTPDSPHLWFMSKQAVATDFDYSAAVTGTQAVAGNNTKAGQLGEPVTALIAHSDQCLIYGCTNSIWIMRGDPATGGRLSPLSHNVGVLDRGAWCYDPEGFLYMMTQDGLYVMPPGCGSTPSSVSRELLPEELLNIDRTAYTCNLAYDFRHRGIHIFVTKNTAGTTGHWWVDTKSTRGGDMGGSGSAAFWPQSFQSDHEPFFLYSRRDTIPSVSTYSNVLLGGRDGYVRRFDGALAQDDGSNAIASHVDYGPFPLAPPGMEGKLAEIQVVTAAGSGDVDLAVRVGQSAEAAYNASTFSTHELNTAGLNASIRPRARGAAGVLRFSNGESNAAWALEEVAVRSVPAGKRRIA